MRLEKMEQNGEIFVKVPLEIYEKLEEDAEMLADLEAVRQAKARLASGEDELLPAAMVNRLCEGENPLLVWREHRGLTQQKLSETSGVNRVLITEIETGKKTGSVASLKKLATALNIKVDDLI